MLTKYLTQTKRLLQNPAAPTSLYSDSDLTDWINIARGQVAGEGECIRVLGIIDTVADQRPYNFADIDIGTSATTGIDGVIKVQQIFFAIGTAGRRWISSKAWEWFSLYELNNPAPVSGEPKKWAQYGQGAAPGDTGSANGGSFYISPPPDAVYTLYCDCMGYPIPLVDDTTVEAIPYLFTDAVPYFAAYYALLSSQTNARMEDAERYYNHYETFMTRARNAINPSQTRWQYAQAADPVQATKLGLKANNGLGAV